MKETNSEHTIKDRCERSCGNIGKMIALRELFRCLSYNAKKQIPAQLVKNYVLTQKLFFSEMNANNGLLKMLRHLFMYIHLVTDW